MSTSFPTGLDSLSNPTATDKQNNPDHATQHANANDAIEAIQAKLGIDSSAVTTSHDYKLTPKIITMTEVVGTPNTADIDLSKNGAKTIYKLTMTQDNTLTVSNATVGDVIRLILAQDGSGSHTPTFFSTISWSGGSAPTVTSTASKSDMYVFVITSAGNYAGFIVGQNF